MQTAFQTTDDSLRADRGWLSGWFLLAGIALVAAWLTWAWFARVTRYEVSESARLEVADAASPIEAAVSGVVVTSRLTLGQPVEAGQVLVELDDLDQQLAFKQEQTRRAQLTPQLAALQMQMRTGDTGRVDEERVLAFSKRGAEAQVRQARVEAGLAKEEGLRAEQLRVEGLISEADVQKSRAAVQGKQAAMENLEEAEQRLSPELKVRDTDRVGKQRQILAEMAKLEADIATSGSTMERLRHEIEKRKLRAAVSGKLTECAVLHPGAHIGEGQHLGMVLPAGGVQVVAEFEPASAFGKLRAGQHATVRLNGFPWAQFGVLNANIARVAGETRDGKVRVELSLSEPSAARIPLQHGLPGVVEVEVERVSPAAMLLRSAGQAVGAH